MKRGLIVLLVSLLFVSFNAYSKAQCENCKELEQRINKLKNFKKNALLSLAKLMKYKVKSNYQKMIDLETNQSKIKEYKNARDKVLAKIDKRLKESLKKLESE